MENKWFEFRLPHMEAMEFSGVKLWTQ